MDGKRILKYLLICIAVVLVVLALPSITPSISLLFHSAFTYIENHESQLLKPIFICLLVTIVSFPFTWGYVLINIATGYWYGIWLGAVIMSLSAVVGISISLFVIRRIYASSSSVSSNISRALSKLVGSEQKLLTLLEPLSDPKKARSVLLLVRATPLPFGMVNALFAVTKLSFLPFLFWSWLGLIPMQILNCYIGSRLATINEVIYENGSSVTLFIVAFQLLISAIFIWVSVRITRKKLENLHTDNASYYV